MKYWHRLMALGVLGSALSIGISTLGVKAETVENAPYKIKWNGPKGGTFGGAYAIIRPNGTAVTNSFDGTLPMTLELDVPPGATLSVSGGSLVENIQVEVEIYRAGQLCDQAVGEGRGKYATAECNPPQK